MTSNELAFKLESLGVNPRNYSLDGPRDEALCLEADTNGWAVYYFERGHRRDESVFGSEDAACDYFLTVIEDDPSFLT